MEINVRLKKNFTTQYNKLQEEFGTDIARINGFDDGQLSYTDFIELKDQEFDANKYYIDELETFIEFIILYNKIPGKIDGYTLTLKDDNK